MPSALAAMLVVSTAGVSTWAWQATSAQATIIAQERDNAQDERDEANKQKKIAEQQTVIAQDNEEKARKEKEEADRQRVLANEAKLQAEKNQLLAEKQANLALKNIQFIVTEIDDRLAKQPGMSEMRIGMLKVVEKKWDELDLALTGGILGQAIPTQMAIREKIADAWVSLDKLEEANTQLAKVYDQAKQRMIDKGRNDATRKNMSFISMKWAPIKQRLTGDPADRDRLMNEALDLLRDILAHPLPTDEDSPKPFEIAERLQRTLLGIASAQRKRGDLLSATASYVEAGEICTKMLNQLRTPDEVLAKLPPERLALLKNVFEQNLDMSRSGRANILCAIGKVDEAIPIYQAAIAVRRAAFASTPNERSATQQLLSHLINYGQYLVRAGRTDDGAAALAEANVLAEKAYESDSTSAGAKRLLGVTQYYLGVARDAQGLIPDSIVLFERSRVIRTEMKNVSADVANKVDLMLAEARLGNQDAAQALIDDLAKAEVKDPELRLDLARAISQLVKTSDAETAKKRIDQAIQMLERSVAEGLPDSYPIASEPDLKPLKDDPRLANIVAKLLANQTMK
jgi:tetratricopeptide (TPR) repeat protein